MDRFASTNNRLHGVDNNGRLNTRAKERANGNAPGSHPR
jgi:hypothetical protein